METLEQWKERNSKNILSQLDKEEKQALSARSFAGGYKPGNRQAERERSIARRNIQQEFREKPWNKGFARTLSTSGGINLLEEAGGDLDEYEGMLKSELDSLKNQKRSPAEQERIRNKLNEISQFRVFEGNEPKWKAKKASLMPPSTQLPKYIPSEAQKAEDERTRFLQTQSLLASGGNLVRPSFDRMMGIGQIGGLGGRMGELEKASMRLGEAASQRRIAEMEKEQQVKTAGIGQAARASEKADLESRLRQLQSNRPDMLYSEEGDAWRDEIKKLQNQLSLLG